MNKMNNTLLDDVLWQLATLRHDHGHEDESTSDPDDLDKTKVNIAKGTAMLCLFTASTLCGSIPFLLNRWFKWTENNANARSATVVKCMLYFGGGVLLCTTFLHLLPEVKEAIEHLQDEHRIPHLSFHLAELLMCIGFFTMFLVEELIHAYIHNHQKTINENSAPAAFERGHSIRNSYLIRSSIKKKSSNDNSSPEITQPSSSVDSIKSDSTKHPTNLNNVPNSYMNKSNDNNDTENPRKSNQNNNNNNNYNKNMQISSITTTNDIESQQIKEYVPESGINNKSDSKYDEVDHFHNKLQHVEGSAHHNHYHNHHNSQHSHGHCHLPPAGGANFDEDMIVSSLRGLLVVLALSIHELFEGLAVGLEQSSSKVWLLFGAVSAHKLVLAFCVGVELIVTRTRLWLAICYVITFAIVSPIGIGIGILVSNQDSNASDIPSAILQGLATGTLLYVVFFEILSKEKSGIIAWAAFVIGFIVMFGLQLATGHNHSHSHGGGHSHEHDHEEGDHLPDEHAQKLIEDKLRVFREIANEFTQTLPRKINK